MMRLPTSTSRSTETCNNCARSQLTTACDSSAGQVMKGRSDKHAASDVTLISSVSDDYHKCFLCCHHRGTGAGGVQGGTLCRGYVAVTDGRGEGSMIL